MPDLPEYNFIGFYMFALKYVKGQRLMICGLFYELGLYEVYELYTTDDCVHLARHGRLTRPSATLPCLQRQLYHCAIAMLSSSWKTGLALAIYVPHLRISLMRCCIVFGRI